MSTRFFHLLPVLMVVVSLSRAQPPVQEWSQYYGGTSLDYLQSVVVMPDGGFLAVGHQYVSAGDVDAWVVRTDDNGDVVWTETHGNTEGSEKLYDLEPTSDGGYIAAGNYWLEATSDYDAYLLKLDADGDDVWSRLLGNPDTDERISAVKQTLDGGYVMVGSYYDTELPSNWAGIVMLTDSEGMNARTRLLDWEWTDDARDVVQLPNGCFVVVGTSNSFTNHSYDVLLVGLDPDLNIMWTQNIGGERDESGNHLLITADGNLLITGAEQQIQDVMNSNDVLALVTDADGHVQWRRHYGHSYNDVGCHAIQTYSGDFILSGTGVPEGGSFDMYAIRIDNTGQLLWEGFYGGTGSETGYCLQECPDGYILAGISYSGDSGSQDGNLIRLSPDFVHVNSPGEITIPRQFETGSNYPNPFNGVTTLTWQQPNSGRVGLHLFDLQGSRCTPTYQGFRSAGEQHLQLDMSALPSGVYSYELVLEGHTLSGKLTLIK